MARTRRGVARASTGRRRLGLFLLIAGGLYLLMAAEGSAAPPAVSMSGTALGYTENAVAAAIDPALTINEPEADDILSATVHITANYENGHDVLAFTNQLGITGAWNPGVGILTLTGTTTAADYESALRTVTFQSTSDNPSTSARTVQVVVTDVNSESGVGSRTIDVSAVDDPLDVTTTGGSVAFTEGSPATAIDTGLTVVDLDQDVTGATVQVTGSYVDGEDVLAFTNQLGITGNWVAATGTLTLTGTTTPANYQTALRTVTYANASDNPSTLPRSVTFTATSAGNSDSGVRVVAISSVNDPPAAGGPTTVTDPGGGAANVLEDSVPGAANIRLSPPVLTDVDSPAPTQVRIMTVTGGSLTQGDGSVIGLGAGGSLLSLAGGSVDLRFAPEPDRDTDASFDYAVVDSANSNVNSASSTATVPIVPVNDAPSIATSGGSAAFVENGAAVAVDTGATVADIDSANLAGATLQITGNYANGEDTLAFTNQLGISGSWAAATGTLTLNGSASLADYQTAIRSVTYSDSSDNPSTAVRTVTLIVVDGGAPSTSATRTITVAATNDAPTVATSGGSAAYTENGSAVVVDGGVTTADPDSATIASASVQITGNYASGEDVLAFTNQSGIIGSWVSSTGTMSLAGTATLAQYQTALRTITYVNTSDAPSASARTVTFVVDDGAAHSALSTRGLAITAVNDAPVLAGSSSTITYTENDVAEVVDSGVGLTDPDNAAITGATIAISSGYWNGEDVLAFSDQSGISGSWSAPTGTLTLAGSASIADYQTALRTITYANTSDAPSAPDRTVSFTVADGTTNSNTVSATVGVVAVNDLPVATMSSGIVAYTEDAAPVVVDNGLTVADPDDATLGQARVTIAAGYESGEDALAASGAGGITASWNAATGVLTLSGAASPSTYQTVLRSVTYDNSSQEPSTAIRVVTLAVDDPSGSSSPTSRSLTVATVNDAPVAVDDSATTVQAEPITVDVRENDTDVESDGLTVVAAWSSAGGSAAVASSGTVTVTPEEAFVGTLSVGYTISDGDEQDTGTLTVTVVPAADIALSMSARENSVEVGDHAGIDVVVRDDGPGAAVDPVVIVHAGDDYLVTGASTAGGRCDYANGEARCELPDIAVGASALVTVEVLAAESGTLRVSATGVSASLDTDSGDNAAETTVRISDRSGGTTPPPTPRPRRPVFPSPGKTTTTIRPDLFPPPTLLPSSTTVPRVTTTTRTAPTTTAEPSPAANTEREAENEGSSSVGVAVGLIFMIVGALGALILGLRRVHEK